MYPRIEINTQKIKHNTSTLVQKCLNSNIEIAGVTKVFCADPIITQAYIDGGVSALADSRIKNLKKLKDMNIEKWLLRLPSKSEIGDVIEFSDVSLNSDIEIIELLSNKALEKNKIHEIILMVDLGDLREGIFDRRELFDTVRKTKDLKGIKIRGIGTNLTCYGGVIPNKDNLSELVKIKEGIEDVYGHKIVVISGGNSSSLYLVDKGELPTGINQLRLGEALVLGRETSYGERIKDTYDDAFILKTEIIEIKTKPSVPIGEIGMDAFGNKPVFEDKGDIKRCICAIGRQDVSVDGIIPIDSNIEVIGASSDHLILDITKVEKDLNLGDIIEFKLTYSGILSAMTSPYVNKHIV